MATLIERNEMHICPNEINLVIATISNYYYYVPALMQMIRNIFK